MMVIKALPSGRATLPRKFPVCNIVFQQAVAGGIKAAFYDIDTGREFSFTEETSSTEVLMWFKQHVTRLAKAKAYVSQAKASWQVAEASGDIVHVNASVMQAVLFETVKDFYWLSAREKKEMAQAFLFEFEQELPKILKGFAHATVASALPNHQKVV